MRKIAFILTMALLFSYTLLQAAPKEKTIVVGTFAIKKNADRTLKRLKETLGADEKVTQLKESAGFDYVTRRSGPYYIVAIEPIVEYDVLNKVLSSARDIFADAFVNIMSKNVEVAITDDGYTNDEVQELVESAQEDALEDEDEALEDESSDEEMEEESAVVDEQDESDDTVSEVEDEAENEIAQEQSLAPSVATTDQKSMAIDESMMLYIAIAAVVVLLLLVLLLKRKKSAKKAADRELEEVMPSSIVDDTTPKSDVAADEEDEPLQQEQKEQSDTPAQDVSSDEKESVDESEVAIQEPAKAEPDEQEELTQPEEPKSVEAEAPKSRKKREKDISRSKIQKSDFNKFSGARILIAEDNLINQKVITGLLSDSGMELVIAEDGQICLDILAKDKDFDLVLMDAHMPNVDGFEATRAIRADASLEHIPVIALSGDTSADDIRKMNEAGMEDTLEKPLKMDALYDVFYCYIDPQSSRADEMPLELIEPSIPQELPEIEIDAPAVEHLDNNLPINIAIGLQIAGGDKELYTEIVKEFAQMYQESDIELNAMIQEDRYDEALSLLLDVQGLAGNIGAGELYEIATLYRVAINERNQEKIETMQNRYSMELLAVVDQIQKGDL